MKRNGWPQAGSVFYWFSYDFENGRGAFVGYGKGILKHQLVWSGNEGDHTGDKNYAAVPLASELMERMQDPHDQKIIVFKVITGSGGYGAMLGSLTGNHGVVFPKEEHIETAATLPDALAKLALHLIKEGILKP